ncbi:UvrD-helicase domain-containing protein [Flavobacterium lacisediminis]|uniref:DNA 3'-5' helicase II n=1 Tax=Flavobacterium lacisediminis TaxID=2989705 RepID=A0ABT3EIE7_9FLAO|nr:UvrD-helicase domain-containing protein [Flavobacterium lacisediminis]MCW1148365.1 UvrD-helicase domain-containing protein [Flavobacterium lacisediminis]
MPQEINISDEDIRYAEKLLLPLGKEFDDERKNFIRNLNNIDLQAVPGSGKTTALLAKLVILERKLPFSDGSGILVLSHTNAAIDEIKEKIQKHSPKLFLYPNFVGTIQSFVDEFLAIPIYNLGFRKKLNWIDTERYQEELVKLFNIIAWNEDYDQPTKWFYQRHINRATSEANNNNNLKKEICKKLIENEVRGLYFDFITKEIKNINGDVLLRDKTNKKFIGLKTIIVEVLKKGIMSYDYAYHFGELYLHKIPAIKQILQKRFPFVFVDEMQDMDTHQYNLLEKIFYNEGNSISVIQRIGDKNQAIYNSVKATDVWIDRLDVLRLSGSQRLSKPIADIVKKFALHSDADFDIVGLNECVLKPHILVFENKNITNVIPFFAQIVKTYKENGILTNPDKSVKVICWNTDWKDDFASRQDEVKLRLEDYHKGFKKEKNKPKQDYDCLKDYLLYYDKNKKTLEPLRKNILSAFLKILRLENINTLDQRPYTKKKLIDFIREKEFQKLDEFNLNLYNWSIGIIKGKTYDVWNEIKAYTINFFAIFSENALSASLTFINNDPVGMPIVNEEVLENTNYYKVDGLEIEITSVHSVKGQTHCATLYLESYYHSNYESERLTPQFLGNSFNDNRVHHKSSIKMAYVGFSRPSDLLCIAIHKDRFNNLLNKIDTDVWEIIEVTNIDE